MKRRNWHVAVGAIAGLIIPVRQYWVVYEGLFANWGHSIFIGDLIIYPLMGLIFGGSMGLLVWKMEEKISRRLPLLLTLILAVALSLIPGCFLIYWGLTALM